MLRMLEGSPEDYLHKPIVKYLTDRGTKIHLNQRVLELRYEVDSAGKPIQVNGFVTAEPGGQATEHKFDIVVAATDVPGIQKLLPESFRSYSEFDKIYSLEAVPVETVQLRFDGWVTELTDPVKMREINKNLSDGRAPGLDNLLYSADADFSCFADLALTSPGSYYKDNEGSLMQCVLTPGDKWMPVSTEDIAKATLEQVYRLFPSAKGLKCTWWCV